MLNRSITRHATALVYLPFSQVTVAVVGLSGQSDPTESLDPIKHFRKNGMPVTSVGLGIFEKDFTELSRLIDPSKPLKDLPQGKHRELMRLLHGAKFSKIQIQPVGRHFSHALVRTSWMAWDHPLEMARMFRELFTLSLTRKLLTKEGYRYFEQVTPFLSHQIYVEPARFAVLKFFKDLKPVPGSGVVLTLPLHLMDPAVQIINEFANKKEFGISNEDVDVLLAQGASFWLLLSFVWLWIPILSLSLSVGWLNEAVGQVYRRATGGLATEDTDKVRGMIGTKWVRDLRRD